MKAVVWTGYGGPGVLKLAEVEKPVPKDNEVLIKIIATTVTAGDCEVRSLRVAYWLWLPLRLSLGFFKPKKRILGMEFAGVVEAVGKEVTHLSKGDNVFASSGMDFGSYAEYICFPGDLPIAKKPNNMTFQEAACVPIGGLNALHYLRLANIKKGEKVLVYGATGSIGTFAVQLAKHFGGVVTAVGSARNLDMIRDVGAVEAFDYQKTDFTKLGKRFDVIFDVVGKAPFFRTMKCLNKNGRLLLASPKLSQLLFGSWLTKRNKDGKKVITTFPEDTSDDLFYLKELIESGKIRSVIDRQYPLVQIPDAHRYVEKGQKGGHVVISVQKEPAT